MGEFLTYKLFFLPWTEWILFFLLWILSIPILGNYIAQTFMGKSTRLTPVLKPLENISYRVAGVNPLVEMSSYEYLKALLVFNGSGFIFLFFLLLFQGWLPLNPQSFPGVSIPLAFNTAISFVTNTNWQSYAGETTLSYLSQSLGLTVQNFLSPATGFAVWIVFIRGFVRKKGDTPDDTVGNFWVDMVRSVVYVLLPLSILLAVFLVANGVLQNYSPYIEATTLEGGSQILPMGPVASQVAIKQIGTNGGGFFGANSAHPFENPTALTNFFETLAILLIPSALVYAFGVFIDSRKQGWIVIGVMMVLYLAGLSLSLFASTYSNPNLPAFPIFEGQETRFSVGGSLLWTVSTTTTSNGSVNAMLSSLTPLAGAVALFNMMLEELIFGGIGVGFISMVMFILLTVFLSGLMVGRTPEYLGKKIEKREIQWVILSILVPGALILIGTGVSVVLPIALKSLGNQGPHGLSEMLYAFSSTAANNGSSFAGLNTNTPYYLWILGFVMLIGRLAVLVPAVAIAGLLVRKRCSPESLGSFTTDTGLFGILLICVIVIVGTLAFFPALLLGPVIEHFLMLEGRSF